MNSSEPLSDELLLKAEDKRLLKIDKAVAECKQEVDAIKTKNANFLERIRLKKNKKFSIIAASIGIFIVLMYIVIGIGAFIVTMLIASKIL